MDYEYPKLMMQEKPWNITRLFVVVVIIGLVGTGIIGAYLQPPKDFIPGTAITIPKGVTTQEVGNILEASNIIRSSSLFQAIVSVFGKGNVVAGDFQFEKRINGFRVARMIMRGDFGGTQVKITIPEGSSNVEIAKIIAKNIPGWNSDEFLTKAKPYEGYLFPETYVVFKSITVDAMIQLLQNEYQKKTKSLVNDIAVSGKTEQQIIIMASLLEKEAKNADEARMVAGILWTRIRAGLPLQVDAPFLYILGKTSEQLTIKDLQKDGPYNTYTRKGLPAGPIGNPGIAMIKAAISPQASPYLYYLHGNDGIIRYAKTYAEHLQNKKKYIK